MNTLLFFLYICNFFKLCKYSLCFLGKSYKAMCFEKFYELYLSLIAVYKKPPHNRRLSPTCSKKRVESTTNCLLIDSSLISKSVSIS